MGVPFLLPGLWEGPWSVESPCPSGEPELQVVRAQPCAQCSVLSTVLSTVLSKLKELFLGLLCK